MGGRGQSSRIASSAAARCSCRSCRLRAWCLLRCRCCCCCCHGLRLSEGRDGPGARCPQVQASGRQVYGAVAAGVRSHVCSSPAGGGLRPPGLRCGGRISQEPGEAVRVGAHTRLHHMITRRWRPPAARATMRWPQQSGAGRSSAGTGSRAAAPRDSGLLLCVVRAFPPGQWGVEEGPRSNCVPPRCTTCGKCGALHFLMAV